MRILTLAGLSLPIFVMTSSLAFASIGSLGGSAPAVTSTSVGVQVAQAVTTREPRAVADVADVAEPRDGADKLNIVLEPRIRVSAPRTRSLVASRPSGNRKREFQMPWQTGVYQ